MKMPDRLAAPYKRYLTIKPTAPAGFGWRGLRARSTTPRRCAGVVLAARHDLGTMRKRAGDRRACRLQSFAKWLFFRQGRI